jgi:hypothetical protein
MAFWLKTSGNDHTSQNVVSKYAENDVRWRVFINSNQKVQANANDGSNNVATSEGLKSVNDSQWHHVVAVFDRDGNLTHYVDGVWDESKVMSQVGNLDNDAGFYIGGAEKSSSVYFNGTIDDVMIYNKSLTADEILALYNATAIYHNETLSDGSHTYTAYSQNGAGNVNSSSVSFTVDLPAPNVSIAYPTEGSFLTDNSSIALNYSIISNSSAIDTCWYSINGGSNTTISSLASGDTGNKYPTQAASGTFFTDSGDVWVGPGDVTADDGVYADLNDLSQNSEDLYAYDFNFNLLDDVQSIDGVIARVQRDVVTYSGVVQEDDVYLVYGGARIGDDQDPGGTWGSTFTIDTHGSSSNTWGASLNESIVEDESFGWSFKAYETGPSSNYIVDVDYMTLRVYYSYLVPSCINTTIDLPEGAVNLTLYVNDSIGKVGSDTVNFDVDANLYGVEDSLDFELDDISVKEVIINPSLSPFSRLWSWVKNIFK